MYVAIHLYNKTKKFGTPARKPRVRKTTPTEDRIICRTTKRKPFQSSRRVKAEIGQNITLGICSRTIKRRLQESGLFG